MPENHDQVVQQHDRQAGLRADGNLFRAGGPVAGRAGQHQVVRLRVDENVLDSLQAGERMHRFVQRLPGREPQLGILFQPVQRDHPQSGRPPGIVLTAGAGLAGVTQGRQPPA